MWPGLVSRTIGTSHQIPLDCKRNDRLFVFIQLKKAEQCTGIN